MRGVLLVDDAKFMRNLYRALLEDAGIPVVAEATNGVEGVDAYREHDPDVVVMNIRMPVLDGISATEDIVAADPDATVVICSGIRQEEKMKAVVAAGASDYVTKPFQREQFLSAITEHLE